MPVPWIAVTTPDVGELAASSWVQSVAGATGPVLSVVLPGKPGLGPRSMTTALGPTLFSGLTGPSP